MNSAEKNALKNSSNRLSEGKATRRNRWLWITVVIILVLTLKPSNGNISIPFADKVVHFFMFFGLSVNICYKYQGKWRFIALIFSFLFGMMTEVAQHFIPGRDMDVFDALADTLGIVAGLLIYQRFSAKWDSLLVKLGA